MKAFIQFNNYINSVKHSLEHRLNCMHSNQKEAELELLNSGLKVKLQKIFLPKLYHQTRLEQQARFNDINQKVELLEDNLKNIERLFFVISDNGFINFINPEILIMNVINALGKKYISTNELSCILGNYIVYCHVFYENKFTPKSKEILQKLSRFYLINGDFQINPSNDPLAKLLADFFSTEALDDIFKDIEKLYNTFVIQKSTMPEEDLKTPSQELEEYYYNEQLIKLPSNIPAFMQLLEKCEISDSEKIHIIYLIKSALIEMLKKQNEAALNSHYNNLIFLKDKKGIPYLFSDISDTNLKPFVLKLLAKINVAHKQSFNKVYSTPDNIDIYFVRIKYVRVVFTELEPNIYLILGEINTNQELDTITKRYTSEKNREYIEAVKQELQNPERREILLAAEALQISGKGEKRTRQHK